MNNKFIWDFEIILEIVLTIYIINLNIDNKRNIKKISCFFLVSNMILIFSDPSICDINILLHIMNLCNIFFLYRKKQKKAIVSFSVIYFLIILFNFFQINHIYLKITEYLLNSNISNENYSLINLSFFIVFMLVCIRSHNYIKEIVDLMSQNVISLYTLIIAGFFLDIVMTNKISDNIDIVNTVNKIMIINIALLIIIVVCKTVKIDNKFNKIEEINKALVTKNSELRKIKHDYGAQISYLYGLVLLKRWEDMGKSLKEILDNNERVMSTVSINNNENSIILEAFKPVLNEGVHILLEENVDSKLLKINDSDLFNVLSVIRAHIMKHMSIDGAILIRIFETFGDVVIYIENSRDNISDKGIFDILKNSCLNLVEEWQNFFGLAEVKKMIESNNGRIYVKNKFSTIVIKIVLPMKLAY